MFHSTGFLFFLLSITGIIIFMIMDHEDDAKTTLYVDDAIEVILLLVMFGTALWVRYHTYLYRIHYTRMSIFLSK